MVAKKRASKRVTLQKKYKVERRTKDHHKKLKKGKMVGSLRKKSVDNFVPNSWPYKEDVLKEIQAAKEKLEDQKQRQRDKRQEEMAKRRGMNKLNMDSGEAVAPKVNTISLNFDTSLSSDSYQQSNVDMDEHSRDFGQNSRRAYLRELRKTVDAADVVLMVLDARDPLGTRSSAVEEMVLSDHRKKLVYVLNKSDLVPRDILAGWLGYLRKLHPTIPFKCNTQSQKGNLGTISGKASAASSASLQSSQAVGAEELLGLLKNYSRSGDSKGTITVGIVGFPNVGKSSLVNSLTRQRAVGVSPTPGFTRLSQVIIIETYIMKQ
jgi:nuclear GTP-binding protein